MREPWDEVFRVEDQLASLRWWKWWSSAPTPRDIVDLLRKIAGMCDTHYYRAEGLEFHLETIREAFALYDSPTHPNATGFYEGHPAGNINGWRLHPYIPPGYAQPQTVMVAPVPPRCVICGDLRISKYHD